MIKLPVNSRLAGFGMRFTDISMNEPGAAVYSLNASNKPGKHFIPVKINYTDQDGRQQIIIKGVEYIVADVTYKK